MTRLQTFESERYIIGASYRSTGYKLMDIVRFPDGALEIEFPYLDFLEKLVSLCSKPAKQPQKTDVSLIPGGKLVSGPVVYRHAMSGRMGFFQPNLEAPVVEKMGPPLLETAGHVFSAHFQGVYGFESLPPEEMGKAPQSDRTVLNFNFETGIPPAIKVVGKSISRHDILQQAESAIPRPEQIGPVVGAVTPEGKASHGFLLGTQSGNPSHEWLLLVEIQDFSHATQSKKPAVQLISGLDSGGSVGDRSQGTSFLALSFPVDEGHANKVRKRGGGW